MVALLRVLPMRGVRAYRLRGDGLTGAGSDIVVLMQGFACGVHVAWSDVGVVIM